MPGGPHFPIEVLLSFPTPNYVNPEKRGPFFPIFNLTLLAICYVVVAFRIWIRAFHIKSIGADDALIVLSLLPLAGMSITFYLAMTKYDYDKHTWDVHPKVATPLRKTGIVIQLLYIITTNMIRVSILLLYRRISARTSKTMLRIIWASIIFMTLSCTSAVLTLFLGCRPFKAFWLSYDPFWTMQHKGEYTCYNEGAFLVAKTVIEMLEDFVVFFLPMPIILKLQVNKRTKWLLGTVFGVGIFLCVCGILRLVAVINSFYYTYDVVWASYSASLWASIQVHIAVILASLPAITKFIRDKLQLSTLASRLSSNLSSSKRKQHSHDGYGRTGSRTQSQDDGIVEAFDDLALGTKGRIHVEREFELLEVQVPKQVRRPSQPDPDFLHLDPRTLDPTFPRKGYLKGGR